MKAYAVIGAGLGDEGKGATVDKIASTVPNPLVIRFNGGAQAGHTVELQDGRRHVFSHFGSGALAGAPTFLSKFFVVNPRIFLNEWVELSALGGNTKVTIDPDALITTPFDVALNRHLEQSRGDKPHGSVGIGFGATIERSLKGPKLTVGELFGANEHVFNMHMKAVLRYSKTIAPVYALSDRALAWFFEEINIMRDMVCLDTLQFTNNVTHIFEGAQGLLLDQNNGYEFPHLTRSNTGLRNVIALLNTGGNRVSELDASYVTRCYSTRHGAGPLEGECDKLTGIDVVDHTNKEKPWQGKFRLAPLMLPRIADAITNDILKWRNPLAKLVTNIVLTCMDQVTTESHRDIIRGAVRTNIRGMSITERHGPCRGDFEAEIKMASHG